MNDPQQALFHAVASGDLAGIRASVAAGADVNAAQGNNTPLQKATQHRNLEAFKLLVDLGADVNLRAPESFSIPIKALILEDHAIFRAALDAGYQLPQDEEDLASLLGFAFTAGAQIEHTATTWLLEQGISPHVRAINGDRPLHAAASSNACGACLALVRAGAELDSLNSSGATALEVALRESSLEAFHALLALGADAQQLHWSDKPPAQLEPFRRALSMSSLSCAVLACNHELVTHVLEEIVPDRLQALAEALQQMQQVPDRHIKAPVESLRVLLAREQARAALDATSTKASP